LGNLIYLDNAATTWPKPDKVHEYMTAFFKEFGVNPGRSGYDKAMQAEEVVHQCRTELIKLFGGGSPDHCTFSYNATDSLNQVIQGVLWDGGHAVTTTLEHNSVLRPLYHLEHERGNPVTYIPFNSQGFIDPDDIKNAIRDDTKLVIVNHGSNVIGTCQDIAAIGKICRDRGVFFAVDASQTAGVVPVKLKEMNIDAVCFTGHKSLFGPTGIGGICTDDHVKIKSTRWGGTGVRSAQKTHLEEYPFRLEAGTLNTMGIAGLVAGQEFIREQGGPKAIHHKEMALLKRLWEGIKDVEGITIYHAEDLENHIPVLSVNVDGFESMNVGMVLDCDFDIATRTGLHCAPLVHEQMGTLPIGGTVRFSVGPFNTEEHIDRAIEGLKAAVEMGHLANHHPTKKGYQSAK